MCNRRKLKLPVAIMGSTAVVASGVSSANTMAMAAIDKR